MLLPATIRLLVVATVAVGPQQKAPEPLAPAAETYSCDVDGVIRCRYDQVEVVIGSRSLDDMRTIGKFIQLVSERNRRYYVAWQTRQASASYELVRRVKSFPYLPYGDTYSIIGVEIILNQTRDRIVVRYPKKPKLNSTAPMAESDFATYETKLSALIKTLQKENDKLKKYEK